MSDPTKPKRGPQWSNSYEEQLSDGDLLWLHSALLARSPSDKAIRDKMPVWKAGRFMGQKVSCGTLSNIRDRLEAEEDYRSAEDSAAELVRQRREREPQLSEEELEEYGQQVFTELTIVKQDLAGFIKLRSARNRGKLDRAKLDLKERQHKLDREKFEALQLRASQADAAEKTTADTTLSPEEKARRYREIFGLA